MPKQTIPLNVGKLDRIITQDAVMNKMTKFDYIYNKLKIKKTNYYKILSRWTVWPENLEKIRKHYDIADFIIKVEV